MRWKPLGSTWMRKRRMNSPTSSVIVVYRPGPRHFEEEPQRGHGRVDGRRLHTGLGQMQLERAQLLRSRGVGGTAEESREPLDGTEVLALRIGHEPGHAHGFEHALAQRADGLLAHWGLLS